MSFAPGRRGLALRFCVALPLVAGGALVVASYVDVARRARDAWIDGIAAVADAGFDAVGYPVRRDGPDRRILRAADGHGVRLAKDCDGVPTMLVFVAAVAVSPVAARRRVAFALAGAAVLYLANLARIGHLLWLSDRAPETFRAAHEGGWPAALLLLASAMYLLWARRAVVVS